MLKGQKQVTPNTPIVPISVAADLLGLHVRTLMLYEYEKLVVPQRTPSNRRLYSQNEIKKLKFIQYLTRKKKLNFAGIRLIFSVLEKGQEKGIDMRMELFPDFKED